MLSSGFRLAPGVCVGGLKWGRPYECTEATIRHQNMLLNRPLWDRTCTDLNSLCYNSVTGQGQLLWVGVCLCHSFGQRFSLVSMVSINLGIWFYGVEIGDTGESIEPEESH